MIAVEIAEKEVGEWLDYMGTVKSSLEKPAVKVFVELIKDSVCKGHLIINEDKTVTQKLKYPLGDGATSEIKYSFRMTVGEMLEKLNKVNQLDEDEVSLAKLHIASKLAPEILKRLDRSDYMIARSLTVFF